MIAVGNDGLWRRFAHTVGLDHLVDDDRYAANPDRVRNRSELLPVIDEALAARSAEEWTDLLTEAGVPVGPILSVPETVIHPQILARDMVVDLPHSTEGTIRTLGSPLKLSDTPPTLRHASPTHGQHTAEILADMGLTPENIDTLRSQGSICG
jgi:crotonobetainyl-CoA:carnitine CoA-transferase CaiB-like acyl-CoA transferase